MFEFEGNRKVKAKADALQDGERSSHEYYGVNASGINSYEKGLGLGISEIVPYGTQNVMDLMCGDTPQFLRELSSSHGVKRSLGVTAIDRRENTRIDQMFGVSVLASTPKSTELDADYRLGNIFDPSTWNGIMRWVDENGRLDRIICRAGLGLDIFENDTDFRIFNQLLVSLVSICKSDGKIFTQVPFGYDDNDCATLVRLAASRGFDISVQAVKEQNYRPWRVNKGEDLGVINVTLI